MHNLYVWTDHKYLGDLDKKFAQIARRYPFLTQGAPDGDGLRYFLNALFPDGMPMSYFAANVSLHDNANGNVLLGLRPQPYPDWPFPNGVSFMARGRWPRHTPNPVFMVQDFLEVADAPLRDFERNLSVIVYQQDPQTSRARRTNNVLTLGLAGELPPISRITQEKLQDWSEFLAWKRRLVTEKARGLRYVARRLEKNRIMFEVVANDEQTLKSNYRAIARQDVMAFDLRISSDPWSLRLIQNDRGNRGPKGFTLGQPENLAATSPLAVTALPECTWDQAVGGHVIVPFSEDDLNRLSVVDDSEIWERHLFDSVPEQGFLSLSTYGDQALISRHENAINRLRDQGGYAPYLSSYLFDVKQANLPGEIEKISDWFRNDLNEFQKEAVEKIVAAPDLCLIQGPPGTGKTTVIAEAIMQLTRRGQRVLLASQAHTAVDNALERLGRHAGLRAIRLARDDSRITQDGKGFAQSAALTRYYASLADQATTRYLAPWAETEQRLARLRGWHEHAEYICRDLIEANGERERHAEEELRLHQAQERAWQRYQALQQSAADKEVLHQRLRELEAFLIDSDAGTPSGLALPEPHVTDLAHALFGLTACRVKLPVRREDWQAIPEQRPEMLTGLMIAWRRVQSRRADLQHDLARLEAAGPGALEDPRTAMRLAECVAELKKLDEQLEHDESLLGAWKAKRQEIKQLRGEAGGRLNYALYDELFSDSEHWCGPVEDAFQRAAELRQRLAALDDQLGLIEAARLQMLDEAIRRRQACRPEPTDDAEWRQSEEALERHRRRTDLVRRTQEDRQEQASRAMADCPLPYAADSARPTLAGLLAQAQYELERLEAQVNEQAAEQVVWGQLVREWAEDLRRPDAAVTDWDTFKDVFVPQCNVVAITCNEREQTLEDSQQAYFDVAIIDEVSKATPLEMLLPLMRARRAVLVGDHRQLPPLFQEGADAQTFSDVVEEEDDGETDRTALTRENLERFEKMVTASLFKSHFESADDSIRARLEVQFRMHPQIMSLVNHFYEQRLKCGLAEPDKVRAHRLVLLDRHGKPVVGEYDHVLWVDTSRNLNGQIHQEDLDGSGKPARSNRLEAELIAHTLVQLDQQSAKAGYSPQKRRPVGVVSFYARQCRLIREAIRKVTHSGRFSCLDVEVNTVIRYQGKEKPIILVSLVRHDGRDPGNDRGQPRRRSSRANVARYEFINVAFSRAQELLIVFGARSMFEPYEVRLPYMDRAGYTTRPVYRDIFNQLEREARLIPASQFMDEAKATRPAAASQPMAARRGALR